MTYEESYKYWKNRYEAAKDFRDPHWECGEAREHREWCEHMKNAFEALEKAEKDRWHDLRKDPNDLPKTSGLSYVPCMILREYSSIPEYAEYEFFEGYGWGFFGIDYKSIKAWKYFELEQFEAEV